MKLANKGPKGLSKLQSMLFHDIDYYLLPFIKMIFHRDTGNLRRHVRLIHSFREDAVMCPRTWCSQEFNVVFDMREHKKHCFKVCPTCSRQYTIVKLFQSHLRGHAIMERRMV